MKIRLIWVGKTKERWIAEGINKYLGLLGHMAQVETVEIKEDKGGGPRAEKEADRLLKQAGSGFVLLDEHAEGMDSAGLAGFLKDRAAVEFVIGGPFGVSDRVKEKAAFRLSLSPMTFTHEMARVVLLEQLYRAMMIMKGRSYHY